MTTRRTLLGSLPVGAAGVAATALSWQSNYQVSKRELLAPQQFGAAGDGQADDTLPLTAWLASGSEGQTLRLPAGTYRTTRALRTRIGGEDRGLRIIGDGAANTAVILTGAGSEPVLSVRGNMPSFDHFTLSGLRLERPDGGMAGLSTGAGLQMENVRHFAIDDLRTFRNGIGMHLIGCLNGRITGLLSYYDKQGMRLEKGPYLATPNVIAIDHSSILASLRIGVEVIGGTSIAMRGTGIESTGIEAPSHAATGLLMRDAGHAGGVAIAADCLYFEDNHGSDIVIEHPDRPLTYRFVSCVFNRFAKSALASSIMVRSGNRAGAPPAILDLSTSAFLGYGDDYRALPERPAVGFDFPNGYDGLRLYDEQTLYQFAKERPQVPAR